MRTAVIVAGLALATSAIAQTPIPIPAFGSTFNAALTRGFWFQAPVNFQIAGLRVPDESFQGVQVVEVIDLGTSPPPAYPGTVTGTQLFYSNGQPSANIIPCAITCVAGNCYGILGACGSSSMANSYGTPNGPFTSTVLGQPMVLTRFGTQSSIAVNGGNQPCWQEAAFQVSRVEVYLGSLQGYASAIPYGTGCYNTPGVSFYENYATSAAFDLANTSVSLINTGTGYLALGGVATYVAPSATAVALTLGDDTETSVTLSQPFPVPGEAPTTSLTVCSNGYISSGTGNGTAFTPTVATLLNGSRTMWCLNWHDYNPAIAGSGQVRFEEVGGIAYITWDGVWDYAGTSAASANTMQAQFDFATGSVHYVYGVTSAAGNARLVGFSEAGPSNDPGSIDISALLPSTFQAATFNVRPLTHNASARPVIGTNISLDTTNVPSISQIGATLFGLTEITNGLDLTGIGMPGCSQYLTIDASMIWIASGGAGSTAFNIPNVNAFAGVEIKTQSAAIAPGVNTLGALVSNGLRLTIDIN